MTNDNRQLMKIDRQVKYEIYILDGLTNRQILYLWSSNYKEKRVAALHYAKYAKVNYLNQKHC